MLNGKAATMDRATEIRKLPPSHVRELAHILDAGDSWKRLMAVIPRALERDSFACDVRPANLPKYHTEHFRVVEGAGAAGRRTCTEVLLDEWGTSGRVRPAVGHLLHLLARAGLYRAADYVAERVLGEPPVKRPGRGPAAAVAVPPPPAPAPVDGGLRRVLDERIHRQVEYVRRASQEPTRASNAPLRTPEIVVSESPDEAILPAFFVPLIVQREKPALEMSDVDELPRISELLVDDSSTSLFSSPDLDTLLHDSSSSGSIPTLGDSSASPLPPFEPTVDPGSNLLPDLSFLIPTERLPRLALDTDLPHFPYAELDRTTGWFNEGAFEDEQRPGRLLGTGAFGAVFLASGLLDRPVAVKRLILEEGVAVRERDLITGQFRNEVEVLSRLRHANLLALVGYSCDGPTYCLVYEYAAGGSLEGRLQRRPAIVPLSREARTRVALGAARALQYLHAEGLVHRDVKSANILLDGEGEARLSDFGMADLAPGQAAFGTSAYMAPEAHRGHVSDRLDVFAFGVVLLELLTGLPPVDDQRCDIVTVVEEKCEDKDVGPLLDESAGLWREDGVDFARELARMAFDCIEYDRSKRPSMAHVTETLEQLAG